MSASQDGRIVEIGRIRAAAERTIDADGLIVAPGFIDGHTHMDAQVAWDPIGSCSCWHGVTSVVMGNCGFALAPCKPEDREWFARCLTAVEDIPTEAMLAGIDWNWETFPEYLANVERLPKALNYGMYIGHSALRMYAMGRRGLEESASEDDLRAHGACGRRGDARRRAGLLDLARDDARHPGRLAGRQPHRRLGGDRPAGRRDGGELDAGIFQIGPDISGGEAQRVFLDRLRQVALDSGRPIMFGTLATKQGIDPNPWDYQTALDRRDRRAGRPHVGPGDDPLDQRDLLAEILSAVRLLAGLAGASARCRSTSRSARLADPEVRAPARRRRSRDEAAGQRTAGRRRGDDRSAQARLRQSLPDARRRLGRPERRRAGAAAATSTRSR